jgi:hypothetical protein
MKHLAVALSLLAAACGNDAVSSAADAQKAYLGLDASIDKAITLGFAGFNAATSANISPQTAAGTIIGSLTVTGQVDQGSSANKGMRLLTSYADYSDGSVTYQTEAASPPALTLSLKNIPTGTLDGTLVGNVAMSGGESGTLALSLTFRGTLQAGPGSTVQRAPGSTHVTGTATSAYGTYAVDLTR